VIVSRPSLRAGTLIEWGVAVRAAPGESNSGDSYLVEADSRGVIVGVVDGIGHGQEAAHAATAAVNALRGQGSSSVGSLMQRCHEALVGTRGVVMSLASFTESDHTMAWIGVGNVEAVLVRADPLKYPRRESLLCRGGVVGYQLPIVWTAVLNVSPGDTVILATDGVRSGFADGLTLGEAPQQIADRIMAEYARGTDDALVLAARLLRPT
jgi:negative regulator of sigma-B (phosphoserine phosphatase)